MFYARRVRSLRDRLPDEPLHNRNLHEIIANAATIMPLLSQLRQLSWTWSLKTSCFFRLMCNTKLACLELIMHSEEYATELTTHSMLVSLPARCPDLTQVILIISKTRLEGIRDSPSVAEAASRAIIGWSKLESASFHSYETKLTNDAWSHLATLESLSSLEWSYSGDYPCGILDVSIPNPFPTLSNLIVDGHNALGWFISFISLRDSWGIRCLEMSEGPLLEPTEVQDLFSIICNCCSTSKLRKFVFQSEEMTHMDNHILNKAIIPLLCRFDQLEELILDFGYCHKLNDKNIGSLVHSMPSMRRFNITNERGWESKTRISLFGLAGMVQGWPNLLSLTVDIDAEYCSHPNIAQLHLLTAFQRSNLRIGLLDLGHSFICKPQDVATIL